MIAAGFLASISSTVHGVRHDLRVDVRLAHAAGDQLRVLGTEVDDEHRGGGLLRVGHRVSVGRAKRPEPVATIARSIRGMSEPANPARTTKTRLGPATTPG